MLIYVYGPVSSESPQESRPDLELLLCSVMALKYPYFPSELWRRQKCSFVGVLMSRSPVNSGVGHIYCVGGLEAPLVHGMLCSLIPIQAVPHIVRPECVSSITTRYT